MHDAVWVFVCVYERTKSVANWFEMYFYQLHFVWIDPRQKQIRVCANKIHFLHFTKSKLRNRNSSLQKYLLVMIRFRLLMLNCHGKKKLVMFALGRFYTWWCYQCNSFMLSNECRIDFVSPKIKRIRHVSPERESIWLIRMRNKQQSIANHSVNLSTHFSVFSFELDHLHTYTTHRRMHQITSTHSRTEGQSERKYIDDHCTNTRCIQNPNGNYVIKIALFRSLCDLVFQNRPTAHFTDWFNCFSFVYVWYMFWSWITILSHLILCRQINTT